MSALKKRWKNNSETAKNGEKNARFSPLFHTAIIYMHKNSQSLLHVHIIHINNPFLIPLHLEHP